MLKLQWLSFSISIGFDCCNLTLQPCDRPVITREGYLFDKEAILTYVISKVNIVTADDDDNKQNLINYRKANMPGR